jgi:hypothetical protein
VDGGPGERTDGAGFDGRTALEVAKEDAAKGFAERLQAWSA